jgi:hypothetical protein
MTREEQFVWVVQTIALLRDLREETLYAPDVVAYACNEELPHADSRWPPAEDVLRLARRYVTWRYSAWMVQQPTAPVAGPQSARH